MCTSGEQYLRAKGCGSNSQPSGKAKSVHRGQGHSDKKLSSRPERLRIPTKRHSLQPRMRLSVGSPVNSANATSSTGNGGAAPKGGLCSFTQHYLRCC